MKNRSDDSEFNDMFKRMESDLNWSQKGKDTVKSRIFRKIDSLEQPEHKKTSLSFMRKAVFGVCTVIILFSLFIGAAFFSPSVAEVASKIPYLNQLFHSTSINVLISRELEEEGYQLAGIKGGKEMVIFIDGSEQYFEDVNKEVKKRAQKIINGKGYDNYVVRVERQVEKPNNVQISAWQEEITQAMEEVVDQLSKENISILTSGVFYPSPNSQNVIVQIDVPSTEKRIKEIKAGITDIFTNRGIEKYTVEINQINLPKQAKEANWHEIFSVIHEGLSAKKEYQVTGFAYSFHPAPLQIIIKTSIQSSDEEADEKVRRIEEAIEEFLESDEIKKKIDGEPYIIIIRDNEQNKIN